VVGSVAGVVYAAGSPGDYRAGPSPGCPCSGWSRALEQTVLRGASAGGTFSIRLGRIAPPPRPPAVLWSCPALAAEARHGSRPAGARWRSCWRASAQPRPGSMPW